MTGRAGSGTGGTELTVVTAAGPALVQVEVPAGPVGSIVPSRGLLVLTHGSAGGVDAPDLRALAAVGLAAGWTVASVTQPFRLAGRRNPGTPAGQDAAWTEVVDALRAAHPGPLVQAGRSNGARVACRTANGLGAVGVVCLAFPVHPPGRPEADRLAELDAPSCRVLVVQGDRDPFGRPAPRRGRRTVVVVPGADHALRGAGPALTRAVRAFLRRVGPAGG